ncbi:MAG TPA: sigma-70 family RNA polymerase sigma factor [Candidatus Sulfotelmatobacter sp.]|jgi:RNA polymerase sigma-70 factor (ECF subfamily)|nr:sigma-70 family RNA polymerase sigma factor [Candidatus Sulfotelmatobacter sp.]
MSSGPRPVEETVSIRALFEKSGGECYGLTLQAFEVVLGQVADKYLPGSTARQKLDFCAGLKLEELSLARACAAGHDAAWQVFLTRFREKLYDIARGITKEDSSARDLADSLYADLYGTSERDGRRMSRLNFYMGRGSLEGWLRTVLAQEFVNRYRKQKRLVSLEEQAEEGVQFSAAEQGPIGPVDSRLAAALDEALGKLDGEDRLVLASYYLDDRTLTEIGRMIGVHESTISRRLEKLLKGLRKQVMAGLVQRGMNRGQAEEALEADVRYLQIDVRKKLQENRSAAFQQNKGSD